MRESAVTSRPSAASRLLLHVKNLDGFSRAPVGKLPSPGFLAYLCPWISARRAFLHLDVVAMASATLAVYVRNCLVLSEAGCSFCHLSSLHSLFSGDT